MEMGRGRGKEHYMKNKSNQKPPYVVAQDDTKPLLQDPLWSSDPSQAEQAVLRLPPFPSKMSARGE